MLKRRRNWHSDRDGVSTVVSAVLVFGLVSIVFAIYTATVVQDQIEDAEARHLRQVLSALVDLSATLESAAGLANEGDATADVPLGTTTLPFLAPVDTTGTLAVEDQGFVTSIKCTTADLVSRQSVASPGATHVAVSGLSFNFTSLHVLEILVSDYSFGASDDSATLTATSGGQTVATATITLETATRSVRVTATDYTGATLVDQIDQAGLPVNVTAHALNLLDPRYGFSSLLQDAQGTVNLTGSSTTGDLQAFVAYWATDGSLALKGEGRELAPGYQRGVHSWSLVYDSHNRRFLDLTYAAEGGGLAVAQENGQYLVHAPFSITNGTGQKTLRFTLLNISGDGRLSGTHTATVGTTILQPVQSTLACSGIEVVIQSAYAAGWAAAWENVLEDAGLAPSDAVLGTDRVDVNLDGDWVVQLAEARVAISIR